MTSDRSQRERVSTADSSGLPADLSARPTWLSWHWHQRTATITTEWGIEWIRLDTHRHGVPRYVELLARSLAALWRLRRTTVVVQSPSLLLATLAVTVAPVFGLHLVIDGHNESVQPFTHDTPLVRWLIRAVIGRADTVIVTNDQLAEVVRRYGGRPFVLPDAIPSAPPLTTPPSRPSLPVVLVICTYAADEPVDVFIETARQLLGTATIHLTGRPNRDAERLLATAPRNLRVLGYLSESQYWAELRDAKVVVDLTLKPNCLVCGAYEAIAVGKAPILSDDVSSRRLFDGVATFVDNTAESLSDAIRRRLTDNNYDSQAIFAFQETYMSEWRDKLSALRKSLRVSF